MHILPLIPVVRLHMGTLQEDPATPVHLECLEWLLPIQCRLAGQATLFMIVLLLAVGQAVILLPGLQHQYDLS